MSTSSSPPSDHPLPLAVVMITYNEEHNIRSVAENLAGFAAEVWVVDSYSTDATVDLALECGFRVYQRRFRGFGDQWNFAVRELPLGQPWTMKVDPDERFDETLKRSIAGIIENGEADGFTLDRKLWFSGRRLGVTQRILRGWRSGTCRFADVSVNEHPIVDGAIVHAQGVLEHQDSPNLDHWFDKQNRYSTAEAETSYRRAELSAAPRLFGSALERRMWFKRRLTGSPLSPPLVFWYSLIVSGAWRAGRVGWQWASLRALVHRMSRLKLEEMKRFGRAYPPKPPIHGPAHPAAVQAEPRVDDSAGALSQARAGRAR